MRALISGLTALLFAAKAVAAGCTLPADVSTRIGRAQSFVFNWTAAQYHFDLTTRDYLWNNDPGSVPPEQLILPGGTFSSIYVTVNRVPVAPLRYGRVTVITACGIPAGGCPLSWFQANHPNWILLKHDQATPAYEYGQTDWIPLDHSNPEVPAWREANEIGPMLSNGYQGISVDNVGDQNDWDAEGVCSVAVTSGDCASNGGTWTQLYTGEVAGDQKFTNDRLSWLRNLASYVHGHNACLSANITYDPANPAAVASLIGTADIWYDEGGFTGSSNPSACSPDGGGFGVTGQAWIDKVAFINALNGRAGVPNVQENSICPLGTPAASVRPVLEYATASYLLTKNAHTYFLWYFDNGTTGDTSYFTDQTAGGIWPDLYWSHGAAREPTTVVGGVYRRIFANGLALLNPSTNASATYALGSGVYHSFDGVRSTGTITLPPVTGRVLIIGEPPAAPGH